MNNQKIIKFITKKTTAFYIVYKQEIEDREIRQYYDKGYFNPNEYNQYTQHRLTYTQMMQRYSSRMNNYYYYDYVTEYYHDGYLETEYYNYYAEVFDGYYYIGDVSYEDYIEILELVLQLINYNILHEDDGGDDSGDDSGDDGGGGGDYPDEPEE